jgi:surface carbohydrate biosynthesis protein
MNDTILLFIDQKNRDALPVLLIYHYLKKKGVRVICASGFDFFAKFIFYKPKVVLQGNPDIYHGMWTRFISQFSIVTSLPTEQTIANAKAAVARLVDGHNPASSYDPPYIEGIYRFYIWGSFLAGLLEDQAEFKGKIKVVGCPKLTKFEFLLAKGNRNASCKGGKLVIGIALEDHLNYMNVAEFIYQLKDYKFREFGNKVENLLVLNVLTLATLIRIVHMYGNQDDVEIVIRPRLDDRKENYQFFQRDFKNVSFNTDESPHTFFDQIDCLILAQSSIGTEAQMAGVPVLTVYKMHSETLGSLNIDMETKRGSFFWQPKSYRELIKYIEDLRKGKLPVLNNENVFEEYVEEMYLNQKDLLEKGHPSQRIGEDLIKILDDFSHIIESARPKSAFGLNFFRQLLPSKLRNRLLSSVLYNYVAERNTWNVMLAFPIFMAFKAYSYLCYKTGKLDRKRYVIEYDNEPFEKSLKIFHEIHQCLDNRVQKSSQKFCAIPEKDRIS